MDKEKLEALVKINQLHIEPSSADEIESLVASGKYWYNNQWSQKPSKYVSRTSIYRYCVSGRARSILSSTTSTSCRFAQSKSVESICQPLTCTPTLKGAGKELGLHSQTLQCVAAEYVKARKQSKKIKLRWRRSGGANRSLGWVPINTAAASWKHGQVLFNGHYFNVWDSYGLSQYTFRTASFNEDARGRWYFNVVVEVKPTASKGSSAVGIDLGCKDAATVSTGEKLTGRWYRELEDKLACAQRAGKRQRVKAIHAKVANRRKDALHKISRRLVDDNDAIFVGNVNSRAMAKTRMSKSLLDAGWGIFKSMLEYKCTHAGVVFEVVNERNTTQTCSSCGDMPDSRPKGIAGLGIREWTCSACGDTIATSMPPRTFLPWGIKV